MPLLLHIAMLSITLWGVAQARPFLVPLFISALLAFLLAPFVRLLRRFKFPEPLALTLSAILLVLPLPGFTYVLIRQGQALVRDFPKIANSLESALRDLSNISLLERFNLLSSLNPTSLVDKLISGAGEGIQLALAGLGALVNAGSQLLLVLLFTLLMLASRAHLRTTAEEILASPESRRLLDDVTSLVERFLLMRLIIVAIVGFVDFGILTIFGLNYSVLIATFLGLLTLIPMIGFILAVLPPILVSISMRHSLLSTVALIIALLIVSVIEGNLLTPKMVGKSLNLNALSTFIGLFAGGLLWGIWGMLLSVPILGVLRIALSASPSLSPWGDLLAADKGIQVSVSKQPQKKKDKAA